MKKNRPPVFLTLVLLLSLFGCNLPATLEADATAQPTRPPATQAPPTSTATPTEAPPQDVLPLATQGGARVSANGVEFLIPPGLGSGANVEIIPAAAGVPDGPDWDAAPAHSRFALQGYPITGTPFANQPTLLVYPAAEYAAANSGAAKSLDKLKAILAIPAAPLAKEALPTLAVNAALAMAANMKIISFQSGSGVRMLAFYAQGVGPVTNPALSYHFHGLTADGKYYVIANLPISAPFLQEEFDGPLPADGIPFPSDMNDYPAYIKQVEERLEAAEAEGTLSPAISALDALVQSIKLAPAGIVLPTALPTTAQTPAATTPGAACSDAAEYVRDVTVPDGTVFKPDEKFTKTWALKNTGNCTWDPNYRLVFKGGDLLGGLPEVPLTAGNFVAPGATVEVSVELQSPTVNGSYTGYWAIRSGTGQFPPIARTLENKFYVQINVGTGGFQVTKASVRYSYVNGPIGQACTWARYTVTASVTANGTGVVAYQWIESGTGAVLQTNTLIFNGPGTQVVEMVLSGPFSVPTAMTIAFTTDKPDRTWSPVLITCASD